MWFDDWSLLILDYANLILWELEMDFPFGCSFHSLRHILVLRKTRDGAVDLKKNQGLQGAYRALQTFSARGAAASFFSLGISWLFNSQQECFPAVDASEDPSVEIMPQMHRPQQQLNLEFIPSSCWSINREIDRVLCRLRGRSVSPLNGGSSPWPVLVSIACQMGWGATFMSARA